MKIGKPTRVWTGDHVIEPERWVYLYQRYIGQPTPHTKTIAEECIDVGYDAIDPLGKTQGWLDFRADWIDSSDQVILFRAGRTGVTPNQIWLDVFEAEYFSQPNSSDGYRDVEIECISDEWLDENQTDIDERYAEETELPEPGILDRLGNAANQGVKYWWVWPAAIIVCASVVAIVVLRKPGREAVI